ncbi:MAG: radical SAM protein [Desulfobacterales bacterium]|jgi:pyruvate-formate lyase-activating enzyme|nr:radical SAM protein [Desulfobacterales bacterium]
MKLKTPKKNDWLTAVVADSGGRIFDLPGYAAVGMAGEALAPLRSEQTIGTPYGSELMFLPDRVPVLFDLAGSDLVEVPENPHAPGEPIYPVALFNSPGHVITHVSAYRERSPAGSLPLFSYGAVGWQRGKFRSAALVVDREPRQDLRRMPLADVRAGVRALRKRMPENRLRLHLETCALTYGCPAGKNFFLGRYEAPLPTAVTCNARCLGCLSLQKNSGISCTQERIAFTPSPEEIAEVALFHIDRVKKAVVSFGQGCEGEPLSAARAIEPAIRLIRSETGRGTINLNTNASLPEAVSRLCDAGLDSIRVSLNSVRRECYEAYFRPGGYAFEDVLRSIDTALEKGRFVSINYLNSPGFTDTPEEAEAFLSFMEDHPIHMIQWRNLNYDPIRYWKAMDAAAPLGTPIGMKTLIQGIRDSYPHLKFGYFNPPKEKFGV